MGIVSSNPSIIGNTNAQAEWGENSVVIGLLGQVQVKASNENGVIRAGDRFNCCFNSWVCNES